MYEFIYWNKLCAYKVLCTNGRGIEEFREETVYRFALHVAGMYVTGLCVWRTPSEIWCDRKQNKPKKEEKQ